MSSSTPTTRELDKLAGIDAHLVVESAEGFKFPLDSPLAKIVRLGRWPN
jgi:hypothetical protein